MTSKETVAMTDSTKSQLETLPDELLLEIFRYMSPEGLSSFKGLNKRIDSIVSDVKISFNGESQWTAGKVLCILSPLRVIRVEIDFRYWKHVHTMENLRSLTLDFTHVSHRIWREVRRRMSFLTICIRLSTFRLCNRLISHLSSDLR